MTNDETAVSVVMPCYSERRLESIRAGLESVEKQQLKAAQVVVAVDNNSRLAHTVRRDHPWVTVVENRGPCGASATRNRGVEFVRTPLVAFIDDDEKADIHWLSELVQPFADPAVVGTGGKYVPSWAVPVPGWFPNEFAWVIGGAYVGLPEETAPIRNVWSGNMAVRTEQFRAVSGFRQDFGKRGVASQPEDTDLCIRMAERSGGAWMYVPSAVVLHKVPEERASLRFFMSRCLSEGAGKAVMRAELGSEDAIETERAYVRTIVRAVLHRLATPSPRAYAQAIVMVLGIACAGVGFLTAHVTSLVRSTRRATCA